MKSLWFMCRHAMAPMPGGADVRPMMAAHLFEDSSGTPVCGDKTATAIEVELIRGFVLSCTVCLALTEIPK